MDELDPMARESEPQAAFTLLNESEGQSLGLECERLLSLAPL